MSMVYLQYMNIVGTSITRDPNLGFEYGSAWEAPGSILYELPASRALHFISTAPEKLPFLLILIG